MGFASVLVCMMLLERMCSGKEGPKRKSGAPVRAAARRVASRHLRSSCAAEREAALGEDDEYVYVCEYTALA